jgi:hypothetical protein
LTTAVAAVAAAALDRQGAKGQFKTTGAMEALDSVLRSPAPQPPMPVVVVVDANRQAHQEQGSMEAEPVEPLREEMPAPTEVAAVAAHRKAAATVTTAAMAAPASLLSAIPIRCPPQLAPQVVLQSQLQAVTAFIAGTVAGVLPSDGTLCTA